MNLITLNAKRVNTDVRVYKQDGTLKAIYPNTGYRPTKATKTIMLNCWKFKLNWIN